MLINLAMQTPIDTCTYKNVNECGDGIIFNEIGNFVFSYLCESHNDVIKCSKCDKHIYDQMFYDDLCFEGIFPEPDKDPVIQIANMVINQGDKVPHIRNVFTLDTCAPIVGSKVISFKKEADLLNVSIG